MTVMTLVAFILAQQQKSTYKIKQALQRIILNKLPVFIHQLLSVKGSYYPVIETENSLLS
jgi:hypothetical protein